MKTVELKINDADLAGWNGLALVEIPAIEENFMAFGKQEFEAKGDNVFLISCSAEKKDHKCAAAELYDSPLFKKSLEFSRKKAKADKFIKIISAKLNLVDLDQVIEPYDLTLKNMPADEQKAWAQKTFEMIKSKFNIDKDRFYFLAGSAYTKYLLPMFKYKSDFLEGKRLGERMQYLDTFSEAYYFTIATNNREYAKEYKFTLVNVEKDIEEEILLAELEEMFSAELATTSNESPIDATSKESTLISNKFAQELAEKMRVIGPVMTPGKMIPRVTEVGEEYQVFFSAETIEKIAYKAMTENKVHKVNIEHDQNTLVEDAFMVETWLVEDDKKDKSLLYGFEPVKGQWFAIYQLGKDTWNDYVKTGLVKGFSVEGYFLEKLLK
jgi:hypothetical protein